MLDSIVPATMAHAEYMAPRLRFSDQIEIWFSHQSYPIDSLTHGVERGGLTAIVEGKPTIMFGIAPKTLLSRNGVPWLLATDGLNLIPRQVVRESKRRLEDLSEPFRHLENYVNQGNDTSINWIKWLGFEFDEPKPYGYFQLPFMRFYKHV